MSEIENGYIYQLPLNVRGPILLCSSRSPRHTNHASCKTHNQNEQVGDQVRVVGILRLFAR